MMASPLLSLSLTLSPLSADLPCSLEAGTAGLVRPFADSSEPPAASRIAFGLLLWITTPAQCI